MPIKLLLLLQLDISLHLLIIILLSNCFFFFLALSILCPCSFSIYLHPVQSDPVIPAFPDLHLSPAAILKELSVYFPKFNSQTRLLTLPAPHELPPREAQEYPFCIYCLSSVLLANRNMTIMRKYEFDL